jgi:uncharacterized repeat protein (TIGR02543 family)
MLRVFVAFFISCAGLVVVSDDAVAAPPQIYNVTFHDNVPGSSVDPVSQPGDSGMALQAFSTMNFSYSNYFFEDWNTATNGSGVAYSDQQIYPFTADVDLYAQWIQVTHSVVFFSNLSSSDVVDQVQTGNSPTSLTSFSSLAFSDANHAFVDWNTQRDGSGNNFVDQQNYSFQADLTLYAQWSLNMETLSYSPNTGSGAATSLSESYGSTLTLPTAGTFSKIGNSFAGWNTQSDGSGLQYQPGAELIVNSSGTLYAQWLLNTETLAFSPNTGAGASNSLSESYGNTVALPTGDTFSKTGNSFAGWNTKSDGSGVQYQPGAELIVNSGGTLYAQWLLNNETLAFSPNGGIGILNSSTTKYGSIATLPSGNSFSKNGYSFVGWNTQPDASGIEYLPGAGLTVFVGETLYAHWSRDEYVISFSIPGVKGEITPISVAAGNPIKLRSTTNLINPGYTFTGWFTSRLAGHLVGISDSSYVPKASMTLYAQWKGNRYVGLEFSDNGGVGHIPALRIRSGLSVIVPSAAGLKRSGFSFRGWATSPREPFPTVRIGDKVVLNNNRVIFALWRRILPLSTPQVLLGSVGVFAKNSSTLTSTMRHLIAVIAIGINLRDRTQVVLYGYATSVDSANGSALVALQRALAVEKQLNRDLTGLNDVGVVVRAQGEGRLSNSVLASFRNVEIFAN